MADKGLDMAVEIWQFFITAHPDADMEAVVKHIAEETRKQTLQEAGEWLKKQDWLRKGGLTLTAIEIFERGEIPE